jgi:uncharacterized protein HemX
MNIIEKIVGLVPTVSDRAKAVRDFITSKKGRVVLVVVLALAVIGYAHHSGVTSQASEIAALRRQLGTATYALASAKAELATAQRIANDIKSDADLAHARGDALQGRLKSQEELSGNLNKKVDDYVKQLATRKKSAGCIATPDDVRSLQRIQ